MKFLSLPINFLKLSIMPSAFYAVKVGRVPGVYLKWSDCQLQVKGFSGPVFKKFLTEHEALNFIKIDKDSEQTNASPDTSNITNKKSKKRKNVEPTFEIDSKIAKISVESDDSIPYVYTDGCCHNNGKNNPKAGIGVYWGHPLHPDNLSEPLSGRQTNNRAEIYAVIRALEQAKKKNIKDLIVYTDSVFLINSMTKWITKWKRNNWKLSNGHDVINREEFEILERTQQDINVKYIHVRGHTGVEGNEHADRLANEGAKQHVAGI